MKNFNQRGSFGGNRGGGGFSKPAMHQATCAECGKSCEVPFKPTGERPVYCSNCFSLKGKDGGSARPSGGRDFSRPSFNPRSDRGTSSGDSSNFSGKNFEILNTKLDKILGLLGSDYSSNSGKDKKMSKENNFKKEEINLNKKSEVKTKFSKDKKANGKKGSKIVKTKTTAPKSKGKKKK
ncbi:MAG: CxxC-x17-CxxC domain-containing protein [Patescibacteria group bacterium]|jgi:CxxC-x17-CxxC domain-containing protein